MTYFQTDPETGELMSGPHEAREDPRTPGHYFLPRGAVTTAPPPVEIGTAAIWTGEAWTLVSDHRGEAGWVNGVATTIRELGPLPEGWSKTPPEPEVPAVSSVPSFVYPRQMCRALLGLGITEAMIEVQLAGDEAALVDWRRASIFERSHPLVASLAAAMEMSEEQVNALFVHAATL